MIKNNLKTRRHHPCRCRPLTTTVKKMVFGPNFCPFFVWVWSIKMLFLVQSFIFPCIRGKNKLNAANFCPNETYTQRLNLCPAANKAGLFSISKFNKYITIRKYDWFECLGLVYTFLLLLLLLLFFELSRHKWLQSWRLGWEGKENEINDFKSFLKRKKKYWEPLF